MLILSRKPGDSLLINDIIEVKVIEANGDKIKLGIDAPREVKILRKELKLTEESNKDSSASATPAKLHSMLGMKSAEEKDESNKI